MSEEPKERAEVAPVSCVTHLKLVGQCDLLVLIVNLMGFKHYHGNKSLAKPVRSCLDSLH